MIPCVYRHLSQQSFPSSKRFGRILNWFLCSRNIVLARTGVQLFPSKVVYSLFQVAHHFRPILHLHFASRNRLQFCSLTIETHIFFVFVLPCMKESTFPLKILKRLIQFDFSWIQFEEQLIWILSLDGGRQLVGKNKFGSMFPWRIIWIFFSDWTGFSADRFSEHSFVLVYIHSFLFEFWKRKYFQILP